MVEMNCTLCKSPLDEYGYCTNEVTCMYSDHLQYCDWEKECDCPPHPEEKTPAL